jgi:hypothetical protein
MDSLKQLQEESVKHTCKGWNLTDKRWMDLWLAVQPILKRQHLSLITLQRRGIGLLLERPWFKRVWILQEVANAKAALVCSGTKSVLAVVFALAPFLIGAEPEPHCQAVLDIMPGLPRNNSWWSQKRDLYTLLQKFSGSVASDPRDRIYALLRISSDARDTDALRADYTKTIDQVVRGAAIFLFGLPDIHSHSMEYLLGNFCYFNTRYLSKIATSCDKNTIAKFLERRGGQVGVTEEVVKAAAGNSGSGKEVMELYIQAYDYRHRNKRK